MEEIFVHLKIRSQLTSNNDKNGDHLEEQNWNKVDTLLRIVDQIILNQAEKLHIPINRRNHEIWRDNRPESMVRWKGDDGIERNIVGYVDQDTFQISVECNAWLDDKVRKWKNENILQVGMTGRKMIKSAVELAFVTAIRWKQRDLIRVSDLPTIEEDPVEAAQTRARRDSRERENNAKLNALLDRLVLKE